MDNFEYRCFENFCIIDEKKNSYFGVEKDFVQICREKNMYIVEF